MTFLTATLTSPAPSGTTGLTASFFSMLTSQRNARKTRKALEALSDSELNDIGLTRGDIAKVSEGRFSRR